MLLPDRRIGWLPCQLLTAKLLLVATLLSLHARGAEAVPKLFSIPVADAEVTLEMFSDQADVQLVYLIENVRGVTTNPVKGTFTPREALERLVARTELKVKLDGKTGAFVIRNEARTRRLGQIPKPTDQSLSKAGDSPKKTGLAAVSDWLLASPGALGPDDAASESDEPVVLSPFEVSAERDTGYVASATLAGTRLRTELRDVAASITVVTKDFMNDIAANNLEDLLTYTAGTEVEGLSGNFSGSSFNTVGFQEFNGASRRVQSETRIRGLGPADQTRDYFLTDVPLDGYNLDRVEVNRGPNAILFGLGSPAGIVNSGLAKGLTNRTKTKVEIQIDDQLSERFVFDHNQVLIKDVLALRVAALGSNRQFQIKPAFIRDERLFVTGTWRPWTGAQMRASTEIVEQESRKPYTTTPMDSLSWWFEMGKPVYNPTTGLGSYLGTPSANPALHPFDPLTGVTTPNAPNLPGFSFSTNRPGNLTAGILQNSALHLVSEDPNSSQLGITGLDPSIVAMEMGNIRGRLTPTGAYANDSLRRLGNGQEYMRQMNVNNPELYNFWKDPRIMDPKIFDFYNHMLEGPNKREWAFWGTRTIVFAQDLGKRAGFEIAYDWQKLEAGFVQPLQFRQNTITIDINTHLMNGMPNPNLGRPMTNTALGFQNSNSAERQAVRVSAYYKLDLAEAKIPWLARLLGSHILTLSATDMDREVYSFGGRLDSAGNDYQAAKLINSPDDRPPATGSNPNRVFNLGGSERSIVRLAYHGPSLKDATSLQGYSFQGVTAKQNLDGASTITALYYERPPNITTPLPRPLGAWKSGTFHIVPEGKYDFRTTTSSGDWSYEETISKAFVVNSSWWDHTLVTTLGWRHDAFEARRAPSPAWDAKGLKILDPDEWKLGLPEEFGTSKLNYGLVLHTPPSLRGGLPWGSDISITYNKSDNFQPTAQRYDIYDNAIAPTGGETEEWGVLLAMFDDKLQLRATRYKTSSARATAQYMEIHNTLVRRLRDQVAVVRNTAYRDEVTARGFADELAAWDAWERSPAAQTLFESYRFVIQPPPYGANDAEVANQERIGEVVSTNDIVARGVEFEVTYNPTSQWRISLNIAEQETVATNTGTQFRKMLDELKPVWNGTAADLPIAPNSTIPLAATYTDLDVRAMTQELLDGGSRPEVRRWRFNAVTNYTIKGGMLHNVRVGGAYRWQDEAAIGFPVIVGPDGTNGILNVKNPYYGPTQSNVDFWIGYSRKFGEKLKWNVQFNMKNVGRGDHLIAVSTQPDGTVDTPRIGTPQTWTLTNTFEF